MSVPAATVGGMKHDCVYFDDGWPTWLCACGARAVLVTDDDGESVLVELDPTPPARSREEMPISA